MFSVGNKHNWKSGTARISRIIHLLKKDDSWYPVCSDKTKFYGSPLITTKAQPINCTKCLKILGEFHD